MLDIVILAAGKGSRMKSSLPKVLHPIAGKPLLGHVIDTARQISTQTLHIIVGHGAEQVVSTIGADNLNTITQTQQLGTAHAVQQALPYLNDNSITLILYGDVPLIGLDTLQRLVNSVDSNSLGLLTVTLEQPSGYGRIIRNEQQQVVAIVEQKDANQEQLAINEVNTGVMAINSKHLQQWLPALSNNNAQGEYYLSDVIALAEQQGVTINTQQPQYEWEVLGVNDRRQQAQLERIFQHNTADQLMQQGVTLADPARFDCRGELSVGNCLLYTSPSPRDRG